MQPFSKSSVKSKNIIMNKLPFILLMCTLFVFACAKESSIEERAKACIESQFGSFTEIEMTVCQYAEIFFYEESFWTIKHDCTSIQFPMSYDCNGDPLCENSEDCMEEFMEQAELLFSFTYE